MEDDAVVEELLHQAKELRSALGSRTETLKAEPSASYGYGCHIQKVDKDADLYLYLDLSSGHRSQPMFWLGLELANEEALDRAISRACPSMKPTVTLRLHDLQEEPGDQWLPKRPLPPQELASSIAEIYPEWPAFWFGRYLPDYTLPLAIHYVKALLGEATEKDGFDEGALYQVWTTIRERDPEARRQALLRENGYECCVCEINFQEVYGALGKNFIHVHHVLPLHEREGSATTKIEDLVSVCPNCHAMLHRYWLKSPGELREIMEKQKRETSSPK